MVQDINFKAEFQQRYDEIISHLQGLIRIPSVAGEASGEYPFGDQVHRAFMYMLDLGRSMGFSVKNVDNYGGHIDFPGEEEGVIGIVCHVDVVPEGDGWSKDPFGGEIEDGWIYGRGTQDDKGATIISLYAMYILKEMGFRPKKTIRLILGLDEETDWKGIEYYLEKEAPPDFGIVPDGDFPLVQCEKGLFQFELQKEISVAASMDDRGVCYLASLAGGVAANVVPGLAEAKISGDKNSLSEMAEALKRKAHEKGYPLDVMEDEGDLTIRLIGETAHGATPEKGWNAISMLMDLISGVEFSNSQAGELIDFYQKRIGFDLDGSRIGCGFSDALSGQLTFNVGKIRFDEEGMSLLVDIRYPVTKSKEDVLSGIKPAIDEFGWEVVETDHIASIFLDEEDPRLEILLEAYRSISGDSETQPKIIGGATFARALPNCIAFGPLFPGDPELEHEKDEGVSIAQLFKAGEIYAQVLYRLAGSD